MGEPEEREAAKRIIEQWWEEQAPAGQAYFGVKTALVNREVLQILINRLVGALWSENKND